MRMILIASSMPISLTSHELCLDSGTYNDYFSSNHIKFYKMWVAQNEKSQEAGSQYTFFFGNQERTTNFRSISVLEH